MRRWFGTLEFGGFEGASARLRRRPLGPAIPLLAALSFSGGCAGDCEDDGFGQADLGADCPVGASGSRPSEGSTGPTASATTPASATAAPSTSDPSTTGPDPSTGPPATGSGDESSGTTASVPTTPYCIDADDDGFGDPLRCVDVPDGESPPRGHVADDTDCDDGSARTFVGAAVEDDLGACTKDVDEDGFGDATPPDGVDAGSDCFDDDAAVFPGAAASQPELCTRDADADGYGDADPPEGIDPGSDCLDDNPFAYPGAAETDDPTACMEDADEDGYGNAMPPPGAIAGTDCDDTDVTVPSASACLLWCFDGDLDQYGDPEDCVLDPVAPAGYVGNDADCDDSSDVVFPGSAPLDDPLACMKDSDNDGYGDDAPSAGITAGSDCDDIEVLVHDACFDCPALTTYCDGDENVGQCNAQGTFGVAITTCDWGCDDGTVSCWPEFTVDATIVTDACFDTLGGSPVPLSAVATGGDGSYGYAWEPAAQVADPNAANTTATPSSTTTYAVTASDGEGNVASDAVTVHIAGEVRDLQGPGCAAYPFADIFGEPDPAPSSQSFFSGGTVYCNFTDNTAPTAYVCPQVMEDARVEFRTQVLSATDDDGLGFVWGWQDSAHFYLLSWKQSSQPAPWGEWTEGITIKRIHAPSADLIDGADLAASVDTTHATVLATPLQFHDQGWEDSTEYLVALELDGSTTTITIRRFADDSLVVTGTITDDAYPSGAVGSYEASQVGSCNGFWTSTCL